MNRTKIEYLHWTWNPIVGCSGVGCAVREYCWARAQAKRQKRKCQDCYDFKPHYHFERFKQPLAVKKPARIGVGFMGDLFDSAFSISFHQQLFSVMAEAYQHTFICLTKQSRNMLNFVENWSDVPRNVWLGVSVNRKEDLRRIDDLRAADAAVKFVSFEPLYEDLGDVDLSGIDWVIIGAQRRPTVQPKREWVHNLLFNVYGYERPIKVFLKNNLGFMLCDPSAERLQEIPEVCSK